MNLTSTAVGCLRTTKPWKHAAGWSTAASAGTVAVLPSGLGGGNQLTYIASI